MNDKVILNYFKNGQREKAFKKLYQLYPKIERLILSKGGSKADASDVFQEALIILNRNLEKSGFELTSSFYTYLYSVSRFVWKDQQNQFSKKELKELPDNEIDRFHSLIEEKKYRIAENAFQNLGARCQELLKLFYLKSLPFKQIAKIMAFKSEKIAKNQKYKCLQKAKEIFNENFKTVQF